LHAGRPSWLCPFSSTFVSLLPGRIPVFGHLWRLFALTFALFSIPIKVAETFDIPVIVSNQVTTRFGGSSGSASSAAVADESFLTAALGTVWSHCVNTRLVLERWAASLERLSKCFLYASKNTHCPRNTKKNMVLTPFHCDLQVGERPVHHSGQVASLCRHLDRFRDPPTGGAHHRATRSRR
jgi:hypothetical protein